MQQRSAGIETAFVESGSSESPESSSSTVQDLTLPGSEAAKETTLVNELSCLSTLGPAGPVQVTTGLLKIDEQSKMEGVEGTTLYDDVEDLHAQLQAELAALDSLGVCTYSLWFLFVNSTTLSCAV